MQSDLICHINYLQYGSLSQCHVIAIRTQRNHLVKPGTALQSWGRPEDKAICNLQLRLYREL